MKRILFTVTLILVAAIAARGLADQQNRSLTVEECVRIGIENSRTLAISEAEAAKARARSSEALTHLLPSLSARASYMRLSNEKPFEIELPPTIPLPSPMTISPNIRDQRNLSFMVQQPLFTGFRLLSTYQAALAHSHAERYQYRSDSLDLSLEIRTAYWSLYKAEKIWKAVANNIRLIEAHLKDTRSFIEQGLATRADLLKVEAHLSQIRLQNIDAGNAVDLAQLQLNKLMGIPLDTGLTIYSELNGPDSLQLELPALKHTALTERAILTVAESRNKAAEKGITAARAGWFPAIYVTGSYAYARPNQRILPPEDTWEDSWEVGVIASFDIWNWGRTIHETRQAKAQSTQAELAARELAESVELQVAAAYLDLQKAAQRIEVATDGVEQAEEYYRITRNHFEEDIASDTDLLDAEVALLQAQTNYVTALADYEIASANLDRAIGR